MSIDVFDVEAETLEEAEKEAELKRPANPHFFSKTIIWDGKPKSQRITGETEAAALEVSKKELPLEEGYNYELCIKPSNKKVHILANDDESAAAKLRQKIDDTASFTGLHSVRGSFLGTLRSLSTYEAEVTQPAVIEIRFRPSPKIRVEVEELPEKGHCQVCGKKGSSLREVDLKLDGLESPIIDTSKRLNHYVCSDDCLSVRLESDQIRVGTSILGLKRGEIVQGMFDGKGRPSDLLTRKIVDSQSKLDLLKERIRQKTKNWSCWQCGHDVRFEFDQKKPYESDQCEECGRRQWLVL